MKKDKWFAAAWAAVGLLYLMIAAFNFLVGQMLFAVPTMLVGWGMCAGGCFYYGARFGINKAFDQVMEVLESADEILTKAELTAKSMREESGDGKEGTV